MSQTNSPAIYRRLPVRRGALPRRGRAGRRLGLPLPHVPEGLRQCSILPLVSVRSAKLDLDARRAESASARRTVPCAASARDCGTPLTYEGAGRHALAHRRLRRAGGDRAAVIQWGTEAQAALCRRHAGPARRGHDGRRCARRSSWPILRLLPASRPRHRNLAAGGSGMSDSASPAAASAARCASALERARPRLHLPLPHVPEGVRLVLRPAGDGRWGFDWTRGAPDAFRSSERRRARLLPQLRHAAHLSNVTAACREIAIGALDEPEQARAVIQSAPRATHALVRRLHTLPASASTEGRSPPSRPSSPLSQPPAPRPRHRQPGRRRTRP